MAVLTGSPAFVSHVRKLFSSFPLFHLRARGEIVGINRGIIETVTYVGMLGYFDVR